MATNWRDPRYQKALLGAASRPLATQGQVDDVASAHASREQQTHNQFMEIETGKRDFKSSMGLARGRLSLAQDQLKFEKKAFKQSLHDKRQDTHRTMLLGLGTAGWSFLEGRRRKELQREDLARDIEMHETLMKHYKAKNKQMGVV
jgi:hypothetical protein